MQPFHFSFKKLCNSTHVIVMIETFSNSIEIGFLKIRNLAAIIPNTFSITTRELDNF